MNTPGPMGVLLQMALETEKSGTEHLGLVPTEEIVLQDNKTINLSSVTLSIALNKWNKQ